MELREKVAQAVSHAAGCPEEWADWFNEADAAIAAIGDDRLGHEDEAWRVAQLAATMTAGMFAAHQNVGWHNAVEAARNLLAESRRQAAVSPTTEDGGEADLHKRFVHPDYDYATTEGPRKCWSDGDRPPEGDGWVRNVHAGRKGWERFDFTEEAYWMRRKAKAAPPGVDGETKGEG